MGRLAIILLALASLVAANVGQSTSAGGGDEKKAQKRKPRFTVGKDTTYVSGPLDANGYIDYVAALNGRLRKGVTPRNNANVLLLRALGPEPEGSAMPPGFFTWLGIAAPPKKGEYLRSLQPEKGERADNFIFELEAAQRPWASTQLPRIAAWLSANVGPLAITVEATRRPEYYVPLLPHRGDDGPGQLIAVSLASTQRCRSLAEALCARAMLAVYEERYDDAWQDVLACHRLGRLVGRGGTLIEALVGIGVESAARQSALAFLDNPKLTAQRIKSCLRDLQALPPVSPVADKIDVAERFMMLDIAMAVDRHGLGYLEALSGPGDGGEKKPDPRWKRYRDDLDWDPALRNANRWYDRLAAAMRGRDRDTREAQLDKIEQELKTLKENVAAGGDPLEAALAPGKTAADRGKVIGDILVTLLIPAVRKVQTAADRTDQQRQNLQLAFALAAYQRDKGAYPARLDALTPDYLAKVPQDQFSGKALIYRPADKGYLLYSVGVNGQDDGGRSYDDDPPGDDLVIRMPLPELRAK
jgi:hypothetical protein